jgi:glycerol-3-phosphate acyltransferase PlsY
MAIIAGLAAFIGHLFPAWLGFKGGKGVATGLGVLLGLNFLVGLIACAVWLLVAFTARFSSLAALLSFASAPVAAYFISTRQIMAIAIFIAVLVWLRHWQNIRRLLAGKESKIQLGKPKA